MLQALDHIIENEGEPVPDLSSGGVPPASSAPRSIGIDDDVDEEDAAAIAAAMGKATAHIVPATATMSEAPEGGAKVFIFILLGVRNSISSFHSVHQMCPVRQDIQGRKFSQLPC